MSDPTPPAAPEPAPTSGRGLAPASAAVPTQRIVTVRNGRSLRWGWGCIGIGVVLVVIGVIIGLGSQALQVAAAKGRAKVGNPVTFEADRGTTYAITLIPEPTTGDFVEDRIGQLDCTATHPGGTTETLDVSTAAVRTSNSVGVFATDFEGRGGSTTVTCDWGGPSDLGGFYAVAKTHKATRYIGTGLLVGGIAIGLLGVGLLVNGYKGRPELQDIGDGAAA